MKINKNEICELINQYQVLRDKIDEILNSEKKYKDEIVEAVYSIIQDMINEKLKTIPVSVLNNYERKIRVKALQRQGYLNIFDLKDVSVEELKAIYGISEYSANYIREKVRQIINDNKHNTFTIQQDDKNTFDKIILSACMYKCCLDIIKKNEYIFQKKSNDINRIVLEIKPFLKRTLFFMRKKTKQRINKLCEELVSLLNIEFSRRVKEIYDVYCNIIRINISEAWKDYNENVELYVDIFNRVDNNIKVSWWEHRKSECESSVEKNESEYITALKKNEKNENNFIDEELNKKRIKEIMLWNRFLEKGHFQVLNEYSDNELIEIKLILYFDKNFWTSLCLLKSYMVKKIEISGNDYLMYSIAVPKKEIEIISLVRFVTYEKSHEGNFVLRDVDKWLLKEHPIYKYHNGINEVIQNVRISKNNIKDDDCDCMTKYILEYWNLIRNARQKVYENEFKKMHITKWSNEKKLYAYIKILWSDAVYQYRADWLEKQSLDIYIPSEKCGVEYQGEQHFEGSYSYNIENEVLDDYKKQLCSINDVLLIEWVYSLKIDVYNFVYYINKYFKNITYEFYLEKLKTITEFSVKDVFEDFSSKKHRNNNHCK